MRCHRGKKEKGEMHLRSTWCAILLLTIGVHGHTTVTNFTEASYDMGEEAQKIGQVMKEFSRRMMVVLRNQSNVDDEELCCKYKDIISEALDAVKDLDPFEPGKMQQARDAIEAILLRNQNRTAFEDMNLFGAFMKVVGDDITDIGQEFIDRGIQLCGNIVIEDGLTDFEKNNFEYCANVFKLSSMQNWKE
ncbi:uncharacterized protein [Dermacentor andersoni]|uniref:uncharacterized protein isoform X1 n=2 Tax=Dermacentor andersoni TaxID=34620 RepID=UPI0024170D53|nr:uncharacterized protein LOC126540468 isoform X1 [Dermacentor andersoni]